MGFLSAFLSLFKPKPRSLILTAEFRGRVPRPDSRGMIIKHAPPEGMAERFRDVKVAGISRRAAVASDFILYGEDRRLELEREPANPVDPNAIKVFGVWTQSGTVRREQLGYVPVDTCKEIAEQYADVTLAAVPIVAFRPDAEHSPGIRFSIHGPRKKRGKKAVSAG